MDTDTKYYLVERTLLPEVFRKVVKANAALHAGKVKTASEAAQSVGLSRSAYYKYKDGIRPFYEAAHNRTINFHLMLSDRPGVLSNILGLFARVGANVLTINQSIPIHDHASVSLSLDISDLDCSIDEVLRSLKEKKGVTNVRLIDLE